MCVRVLFGCKGSAFCGLFQISGLFSVIFRLKTLFVRFRFEKWSVFAIGCIVFVMLDLQK